MRSRGSNAASHHRFGVWGFWGLGSPPLFELSPVLRSGPPPPPVGAAGLGLLLCFGCIPPFPPPPMERQWDAAPCRRGSAGSRRGTRGCRVSAQGGARNDGGGPKMQRGGSQNATGGSQNAMGGSQNATGGVPNPPGAVGPGCRGSGAPWGTLLSSPALGLGSIKGAVGSPLVWGRVPVGSPSCLGSDSTGCP